MQRLAHMYCSLGSLTEIAGVFDAKFSDESSDEFSSGEVFNGTFNGNFSPFHHSHSVGKTISYASQIRPRSVLLKTRKRGMMVYDKAIGLIMQTLSEDLAQDSTSIKCRAYSLAH